MLASTAERSADDFDPGPAPRSQFAKDGDVCARQAEADQRRFGIGGDIGASYSTYNRDAKAFARCAAHRAAPMTFLEPAR
jgi:hypothetical protein